VRLPLPALIAAALVAASAAVVFVVPWDHAVYVAVTAPGALMVDCQCDVGSESVSCFCGPPGGPRPLQVKCECGTPSAPGFPCCCKSVYGLAHGLLPIECRRQDSYWTCGTVIDCGLDCGIKLLCSVPAPPAAPALECAILYMRRPYEPAELVARLRCQCAWAGGRLVSCTCGVETVGDRSAVLCAAFGCTWCRFEAYAPCERGPLLLGEREWCPVANATGVAIPVEPGWIVRVECLR
jgi:hypothetical protein